MNTFIQLSNEDIDTALSHDLREEVRRCNKHITAMQARIEKLDRIKIAAGQVSKNLSKTEIIDIDNKEYNVWSIVGDAEKDELVAALKEAE